MAIEPEIKNPSGGKKMVEALIFVGVVVLWVILQVWVLPKLGVRT